MEVIDLDNPNWLALEDPYVLLGCKAIFDPDTGPDLESCTQDFERCYRCCASCRADCLQHFETNPETLGVYHAVYLAYLHPAQAVEDHAQPARSARRARSSGRRRTRRARPVSQTTSVRRPPSRSKVNPGSPLGQPWVPDFWRASVGPRRKLVGKSSSRTVQ